MEEDLEEIVGENNVGGFTLIDMTATITEAMKKKIKSVKNCFNTKFLSVLRNHNNQKYTAQSFDEQCLGILVHF